MNDAAATSGASATRRALFKEPEDTLRGAEGDRRTQQELIRTPGKFPPLGRADPMARPVRSKSRQFRQDHRLAREAHEANPGTGRTARPREQMQRMLSEKYLFGMSCIEDRHALEQEREFIQKHGGVNSPKKILPGGLRLPATEAELDQMIARLDHKILQLNAEHSAVAADLRQDDDARLAGLVDLSPAAQAALNKYLTANSTNKTSQLGSYRQYGWNVLAGAVGYLPFAAGPLLAYFGNPYAGAAAASLLWLFSERIGPPLLRSVSQPNRAADQHVALYKLEADALEEFIAGKFGVRILASRVTLEKDQILPVTAGELRARAQQRANGSHWRLYRLKMVPDDLTSCFYGLNYSVRNVVCGHFFARLSRPQPGQPASLANWGFEAGTTIGAGILAGALYSLSMQSARRHFARQIDATLGGAANASLPKVTKSFALWKLRALYLEKYLLDLRTAAAREDFSDEDRLYITAVADIMAGKLARAQSKSSFLGNLAMEAQAMVMPGERRNTCANLMSKCASLCLYATVSTLYAGWTPSGDLSADLLHYAIKGGAIVFPLAYPNRSEWLGLTLYSLAVANGLRRGLQHQIASKAAHVCDGLYSMLGSWAPDFTFWRTPGDNIEVTTEVPLQQIQVDSHHDVAAVEERISVAPMRRASSERKARTLTPGGRSARTLAYDAAGASFPESGRKARTVQGTLEDGGGKSPGSAVRQRKMSASRNPPERGSQRGGSGLRTPGESPTKAALARVSARLSGSGVRPYWGNSDSDSDSDSDNESDS